MKHLNTPIYAGLLASALTTSLLIGCDNSESPTGKLNLNITDAAVDGATEVVVEFTGAEIKAGSDTIDIDYAAPKQIDLLALTGGISDTILEDQILPAGQVEWIRLKVNESNSYITINGEQYGLTIPSASQSGLKLNRPITIAENGIATFTIDFDLRKSVHERSGNNYMLRPTLRLVDNATDGTLSGTVDTSLLSATCGDGDKAAIYVFEGNVTADDIGSAVEPVTTATVNLTTGAYTVAFLPFGSYTAAFTCDAGMDDPQTDDNVVFDVTTTVTVTAGQTTDQDFGLPAPQA
ncbi:MAG: DUF4382 domain-containing protein [Gammaproteobacteria bacterium]|jgi:hypothetical protein|nr:DUF4382 domain-containing protein [Gammaproteobacteria bacterium]